MVELLFLFVPFNAAVRQKLEAASITKLSARFKLPFSDPVRKIERKTQRRNPAHNPGLVERRLVYHYTFAT